MALHLLNHKADTDVYLQKSKKLPNIVYKSNLTAHQAKFNVPVQIRYLFIKMHQTSDLGGYYCPFHLPYPKTTF